MKIRSLLVCLLITASVFAQTGKYFTTTGTKCKSAKVFIDHRILEYCGTEFTADWSGICKEGFAEGNGTLSIISKKYSRAFTMTYEGSLVKGKKNGNGTLNVYVTFPGFSPYYTYEGYFKNDEFYGYGEFKSDYPYPVRTEDIGKGISMEALGLDMEFWRSDLFFYEYKGNFVDGRIADTEYGTGKTKSMRGVAERTEYRGAIRNGIPSGKGIATESTIAIYPNEASYASISGNFVHGRVNGYGKQVGSYFEYEGEFVNGVREGKGKLTFYEFVGIIQSIEEKIPQGRRITQIIESNFKNGQADGLSIIYYQNSAAYKYTGPLKEGDCEGTGEIEFLDGSKFRGNFRSGKREGEGSIVFPDGGRFSGEYRGDKPVTGTYYYNNNSKYEGGFGVRVERDKNNKLINTYIRQGRGTITYPDGTKKEVTCVNDDCN